MKYTELLSLNNELLNEHQIGLECFRQWVVFVAAIVLMPLMIKSIRGLRMFSRKLTFDQLILIIETIKVSPHVTS